ncbi:MAG: hypothetical protein KatS3mg109_0530 [Pirellulaceae bacterium]|nr:MAG: hypothetical protein KatS3mg109_0530 [Pirellulaceae bacterium]
MDRMPRWILVERSLTGPGNHHYEYAFHMARAAGAAGFEVLVAGNLRMNTESWGEVPATIRPTFRHTTYEVDASLGRAPSAKKNAWATLVSLFGWRAGHPRQKEAYAREFAREVTDLLAGIEVSGQDHIFFPTLSVAELDGLARVWAAGIASASDVVFAVPLRIAGSKNNFTARSDTGRRERHRPGGSGVVLSCDSPGDVLSHAFLLPHAQHGRKV